MLMQNLEVSSTKMVCLVFKDDDFNPQHATCREWCNQPAESFYIHTDFGSSVKTALEKSQSEERKILSSIANQRDRIEQLTIQKKSFEKAIVDLAYDIEEYSLMKQQQEVALEILIEGQNVLNIF